MSCKECAEVTDIGFNQPIAYYRWKNADIAIVGCKLHVKEVIEFLNRKLYEKE